MLAVKAHQTAGAGDWLRALAGLMAGHAEVSLQADFITEAWRKHCLSAVAGLMARSGRRAPMFRDPAVAAVALDLARECVAAGPAPGTGFPLRSAT